MTSKEEHYIFQAIGALNKIGYQLKRLADIEEKRWNEDHHDYGDIELDIDPDEDYQVKAAELFGYKEDTDDET